MKAEILEFIDAYIRPRVQADGGEVVAAGLEGGRLQLVLMGECAVCNGACGLREWIAQQLRSRFGPRLQVEFSAKKRYFQDK